MISGLGNDKQEIKSWLVAVIDARSAAWRPMAHGCRGHEVDRQK